MTVTSSFPPFSSLLPSLPTKSILKLVRHKRRVFDPWIGKILWRRKRQPTLVFLPGESHEQRVSEDSWRVTVHRVSKSRPQLKRLILTHAEYLQCNRKGSEKIHVGIESYEGGDSDTQRRYVAFCCATSEGD